jgi:hypothetical protein
MNKIEMQLQQLNNQLMQQWFEDSCEMWASHYSFLLNLPWNTEADKMWYKEQINMNKLYDV